jgi:xylulose-5-phosphate/fructose-6-phosphate phosphoketolase
LNLLITSTVWRQDHNGFTHQDPGLLDSIANKDPRVTRVFLPPDANTALVVLDECMASTDRVNLIVVDKQVHHQYLEIGEARRHVHSGLGIWSWAGSHVDHHPDVVMVGCGDVATQEALAAVSLLRELEPSIKVRFVNVVDLFALATPHERPTAINNHDYASIFTEDCPVIMAFHGYPWIVHRLTYRRPNHDNVHVHGYREHGSITTPLQLAIQNGLDRFSLAIAALQRSPKFRNRSGHAQEVLRHRQLDTVSHALQHGADWSAD